MDPSPAIDKSSHVTAVPAVKRSMTIALLLTTSGGFLDAFTYVGHGKVFANSMTGNVVLLAVLGISGPRSTALRHIPPIFAFLLGVFLAQLMRRLTLHGRLFRPALTCLIVEVLFLAIVSVLPPSFPDMLLVMGISLVAAMQNSSFTHIESWTFNSVMTTGNLRIFAEALFGGIIPRRDAQSLRQARAFGLICLCFFVGAVMGALATPRLHNAALWLPIAAMTAAVYLCWNRSSPEAIAGAGEQ